MNFIKGKIIQNPSLNTFINLFNHVLFFTNLWIISFNHILLFLNYYFPPVVKEQFYRPAAAWPEPFEMPIYLVLTVIFVLIMWVSNKLKLNFPFPFLLRFIFLCFLLALFISMPTVFRDMLWSRPTCLEKRFIMNPAIRDSRTKLKSGYPGFAGNGTHNFHIDKVLGIFYYFSLYS